MSEINNNNKNNNSGNKRYNILHYMSNKNNFCIFCWVNNSVVKFVSNIHWGTKEESVEMSRCHPRINPTNKEGVLQVWGDKPRADIKIPGIVDDYNHWMLSLDFADQLILSYCPKICCHCIWMLLFLLSVHVYYVLRMYALAT